MIRPTFTMALTGTLAGLIACTAWAGGGPEAEIQPGDTRAFVIEMLGEPEGFMGNDRYEMLYFSRGPVVLVEGKVAYANLISEAESNRRKIARVQEAEARQRAADEALKRPAPAKTAPAQSAPQEKPAAAGPPQSVQDLSPEQQAELEERIAAGMNRPAQTMSRSKLRRFQRGRSPSALAERKAQITDAFLDELQDQQGR